MRALHGGAAMELKGSTPSNRAAESFDDAAIDDELMQTSVMSKAIVHNPLKVFSTIIVVLVFSVWGGTELMKMKDGIVFLPNINTDLGGVFPATSNPRHDAVVFWCDECILLDDPEYIRRSVLLQTQLDKMRREEPNCEDLQWSNYGRPAAGLATRAYLSDDQTTTFLEYQSTSVRCMLSVRSESMRFSGHFGHLHMAGGGPETVASASMKAEFKTAMKHSIIAVPICGLILWLVTGNVFMSISPMFCVGASFFTGRAFACICKKIWPGLNINFDDSCVLFIVLALCVDYGLFLWTRLNDERAKYPGIAGYSRALVIALRRSGAVILISNTFVTVAYLSTMLLPNLNLWAYLGMYAQAVCACAMAGIYSVTLLPCLAALFPTLFDGTHNAIKGVHEVFWANLPAPQKMWLKWARVITSRPLIFIIPTVAYACMVPFILLLRQYKPSFDLEIQGSRHDIIQRHALTSFEKHFNIGMLFPITIIVEAEALGPAVRDSHAVRQDSKREAATSFPQTMQTLTPAAELSLAQVQGHQDLRRAEEAHKEKVYNQGVQHALRSLARKGEHLQVALSHHEKEQTSSSTRRDPPNVALSTDFALQFCRVAETIVEQTRGKDCEITADDMIGLWWLPKGNVSPELIQNASGCAAHSRIASIMRAVRPLPNPLRLVPPEIMKQVPSILRQTLSNDGKRLQLKVMTKARPSGPEAVHFDQLLRAILDRVNFTFEEAGQRFGIRAKHMSAMQVNVDAGRRLYAAVPKVLAVFVPVVSLAIGISFHSAFLAIKLGLTVVVPIITTYGLAVAVYQMNMLGFLGLEMFAACGGLDFRMMMLTAGILFGFAMDYDLFLFVRVYEHRSAGYDNLSAVKRALAETGPVITTAGTMMVVSFFFIMCSHTIFLRTMGFIFTVGVLFDVYVVRTMLAPAFLGIAENLNYWPGKVPPATKTFE